MWAMVVVKKDKVYGEAMSKSPGGLKFMFLKYFVHSFRSNAHAHSAS
jgi:hypothetical protein